MPYFVDVHRGTPGTTPEEVADAHLGDVEVQEKYGVQYHNYWFDPDSGTVFCLAEGPDEEACHAVHREAHGITADDIIRVEPEQIQAFLGDSYFSPDGAVLRPDGSLDPAFRVILVSRIENLPEVAARHGDGAAVDLVQTHHEIVREALEKCSGREARTTGESLMASFATVTGALRCAVAVQEAVTERADRDSGPFPRVCIGMSAGEPVEQDDDLFGVSVNIARQLCEHAPPGRILMTDGFRELAVGKGFRIVDRGQTRLSGFDDPLGLYEVDWQFDETHGQGATVDGRQSAELETGRRPEEPGAQRRRRASASESPTLTGLWYRVRRLAAEMKRRKVFRVSAAYLAAGFVVLQVASLIVEPLGLPSWSYTLILILTALGFPLVVVLAWAFEMTPDGAVRADEGGTWRGITGSEDREWTQDGGSYRRQS